MENKMFRNLRETLENEPTLFSYQERACHVERSNLVPWFIELDEENDFIP